MPPRLSKWPFLLGDALLLGLGLLIFLQSRLPLSPWEVIACTLCVVTGASCGILPFILEYRVVVKLMLADHLADVTSEIRNLDLVVAQITTATSRWQTVQESADKTSSIAKGIAERMAGELKEFNEFLRTTNEGEKSTLRLEVEKLRRAETDWVQVSVRMLDHVYALQQAAVRSRQASLIEQLGQFQAACRDAARRVGLAPFVAAPEEPFDAKVHQVVEGGGAAPADAAIEETVATGYTFQGRLLRPALVRLRDGNGSAQGEACVAPVPGPAEEPRLPI